VNVDVDLNVDADVHIDMDNDQIDELGHNFCGISVSAFNAKAIQKRV
jgi:hypothetical protein